MAKATRRLRRRLSLCLARLDSARRAWPENGALPFTRGEVEQLTRVLKGQQMEPGVVIIFAGPAELVILERAVARLEAAVAERRIAPGGN